MGYPTGEIYGHILLIKDENGKWESPNEMTIYTDFAELESEFFRLGESLVDDSEIDDYVRVFALVRDQII